MQGQSDPCQGGTRSTPALSGSQEGLAASRAEGTVALVGRDVQKA